MRLIDADALHAVFVKMAEFKPNPPDEPCGAYRRLVFHISEGIRAINDAPTIDAVPVVRCENCKFGDWYDSASGECLCYCTEHGSSGHNENDYCSYGERKDDEVHKDG